MDSKYYQKYIDAAEKTGDPHSMVILAELYKAGAFGDSQYDEYIYWLKRFFETDEVKGLCIQLENNYSQSENSDETVPVSQCNNINLVQQMTLRNDILEAGIALGIYYRNSSEKEELELSLQCLIAALDASAWAYLDYTEEDGTKTDILCILKKVADRMEALGIKVGD